MSLRERQIGTLTVVSPRSAPPMAAGLSQTRTIAALTAQEFKNSNPAMTGGRGTSTNACHSHRQPIAPRATGWPAGAKGAAAAPGGGPCSTLIPATLAFLPIASAIALANFAAFLFIEAGAPQSPTIGLPLAAFGAIAAAVAFAHFPPFLLVNAGAAEALAIVAAPILDRNSGAVSGGA